jgi:hypothetical protein
MISGTEAIYPSNYISEIANRMVKERVIVASGIAAGEKRRVASQFAVAVG